MASRVETDGSEKFEHHIIIIGAGITGLLFAQSLRKRQFAPRSSSTPKFSIYERDPNPEFRGAGWGLTIHWALDDFISLLPAHLVERLNETYVDEEAVQRGETGNFLLFDLQTGEEKWRVPPNKRIRVSREKLRALLMEGLDIQWSSNLIGIETDNEKTITATFEDGRTTTGTLLIGGDGSRSQVRKLLCPSTYRNNKLPVRLLGASVPYPKSRCLEIRAIDPFFFQASDPATSAFLWFSFLRVPPQNCPDESITCQILTSWPYREGFLGREIATEVPEMNKDRVRLMKDIARGWVKPFKEIMGDIPEETAVKTIGLEDWVPGVGMWDNANGRVTLVGDAAHAMTMYRGEAANHGIADVKSLFKQLFEVDAREKNAIERYEEEMIPRAKVAVLTSRRACLHAHDPKMITESSPLVARRVMIFDE